MEIQILNWINDNLHGCGFINQLFRFITYLGEDGIAWALVGVVLLCFKRTRKPGLIVLAGFASVVVLNHFILKNIFDRVRPFVEEPALAEFIKSIGMSLPSSSSFPSGHTTISITSAMILTMCFGKKGAWAFIPAGLISISRLFLCVHYPTDVLAGIIEGIGLGIVVTILGRIILQRLEDWWKKRKALKTTANSTIKTNTNNEKESVEVEDIKKINKESTIGKKPKKQKDEKKKSD